MNIIYNCAANTNYNCDVNANANYDMITNASRALYANAICVVIAITNGDVNLKHLQCLWTNIQNVRMCVCVCVCNQGQQEAYKVHIYTPG